MNRKKKLRSIQFFLLMIACSIIFFTYYYDTGKNLDEKIVNKENIKKVKKQLLSKKADNINLFYNVKYSGLDLAGNRYLLKSKEAYSESDDQSIVFMTSVTAYFYFKDNTTLLVKSDRGEYNNQTLDMNFIENVEANYEGSEMYASMAEYSNLNGFLTILDNVKIVDMKGTVLADKLIFDINKKKLEISSFNNNDINANIKLK